MPYDQKLDDRIKATIADWGTIRKKMFGGTCHLLNGNMLCGVYKDYLILRLGEERGTAALDKPHTKPFDITGRPMKGWIMVEQAGLTDKVLKEWLLSAKAFVETLPSK
ncbi:MAG: TfoX/Sxy family protein [Spirochaetaceae bacterium]|nr:MAG: TfoX/Sxy family protein [Spirochaetaceae bacterium]